MSIREFSQVFRGTEIAREIARRAAKTRKARAAQQKLPLNTGESGMAREMTDVQVQSCITQEFGRAMGGPGSLKWPSHQLVPALIRLAAMLLRLTLRKPADAVSMVRAGSNSVTAEMSERFRKNEPAPRPLLAADHASVERVHGFLLAVSTLPQEYKKPSQLVLGALCHLIGQFAALRGDDIEAIIAKFGMSFAQVPDQAVAAFQQACGRLQN